MTRLVFPQQPSQLEGMAMADMEHMIRQAISIVGQPSSGPPGALVFPQGTSHDLNAGHPDYVDGIVLGSEVIG